MGLEFNPGYDQSVIDEMIQVKTAQLVSQAEFDGEELIFKGVDGKIITGTDMGSIKPAELWKSTMATMLKKEGTAGGGAAGSGGVGNSTGADGKVSKTLTLDASNLTSKVAFNTEVDRLLKANGIDVTGKEAVAMRNKASADYKYADLPRQ